MASAKKLLKQLLEAGRRNSAVDQARIQEVHDHAASLGAQCDAPAMPAKEAVRLAEALRVDDSFSSRIETLRKAARAALAGDGVSEYDAPYVYVRDCFDTDVVIQRGDDIFQIPYTIDGTGTISLGTPAAVDVAYIPATETAGDDLLERKLRVRKAKAAAKPAGKEADSEKATTSPDGVNEAATFQTSNEFVELREAAVAIDGSAQIKVIAPGWGSSGYYSADVLKRDGPKVFAEGTKMFWNHATEQEEKERPEGDLNDLAAELTGTATWKESGPAGPGLYAPIKVFSAYREAVNDLSKSIGVSIRAAGRAKRGEAEGRQGPIIASLESAKSIDFVTAPGAGGEILQLFEAARPQKQNANQESEMEAKDLREANALLTAQGAEIAKLREAVLVGAADRFVREALASVKLPAITKARLTSELIAAMPLKEGALDTAAYKTQIEEAVKQAAAEIAEITGAGAIRGVGAAPTADETKSLQEADSKLTAAFGELGLSEAAAKNATAGRKEIR